jgi:hypothetical protein
MQTPNQALQRAGGLEGKPSCEVLTGRPPLNTTLTAYGTTQTNQMGSRGCLRRSFGRWHVRAGPGHRSLDATLDLHCGNGRSH